jgi:hypothetical protein
MEAKDIFIDAYDRINGGVHRVLEGLDEAALNYRIDPDSNPIGWLIWHLLRVQDHHIAQLAQASQAWVEDGWADRFGMVADPEDIGYAHTSEQVAAVHIAKPQILGEYADAVHSRTLRYLNTLEANELSRIVDRSWDPPVTAAVRLVSVIGDDMQHIGQAAYARGIHERRH